MGQSGPDVAGDCLNPIKLLFHKYQRILHISGILFISYNLLPLYYYAPHVWWPLSFGELLARDGHGRTGLKMLCYKYIAKFTPCHSSLSQFHAPLDIWWRGDCRAPHPWGPHTGLPPRLQPSLTCIWVDHCIKGSGILVFGCRQTLPCLHLSHCQSPLVCWLWQHGCIVAVERVRFDHYLA